MFCFVLSSSRIPHWCYCNAFKFPISGCLLLLSRSTTDFYILVSYPITILNSIISFWSYFVNSFGFFLRQPSSTNKDSLSRSFINLLFPFPDLLHRRGFPLEVKWKARGLTLLLDLCSARILHTGLLSDWRSLPYPSLTESCSSEFEFKTFVQSTCNPKLVYKGTDN